MSPTKSLVNYSVRDKPGTLTYVLNDNSPIIRIDQRSTNKGDIKRDISVIGKSNKNIDRYSDLEF